MIIKKIEVVEGYGYYGGVWKVVYVDFMIVMMVFFLFMWILLFLDEQKLCGIVEYFMDVIMSGGFGVLDGVILGFSGMLIVLNGVIVVCGFDCGEVDDLILVIWEIMDVIQIVSLD